MNSLKSVWRIFKNHKIGVIALFIVFLFCIAGIFAPFLASSKPIWVKYDGEWYFPIFRYLFYKGFYSKQLDLFYNLLIFTIPATVVIGLMFRKHPWAVFFGFLLTQCTLFLAINIWPVLDPAANFNIKSNHENTEKVSQKTWNQELIEMSSYQKLNLVIQYIERKNQHTLLQSMSSEPVTVSLWAINKSREDEIRNRFKSISDTSELSDQLVFDLKYYDDRDKWLEEQSHKVKHLALPLISHFHWEEDAAGSQLLNSEVSWWNRTRINRKDLASALIFGIRISLSVGLISIAIALLIGIPIGAIAGYYGGKTDIIICRIIELWEAMPIFFMLLMIVAFLQSKSIFLVVAIIGMFGWTSFSRYVRGEFLKQKKMPYVEACHSLGFSSSRIIFSHLLPNAIPPLLTLVPFAIMGAITSEAGLSFLGLGEENSCSWGVLMDEGRTAFPSESDLLWPPAILLTTLLVSIALLGDTLRDALDPKMHYEP